MSIYFVTLNSLKTKAFSIQTRLRSFRPYTTVSYRKLSFTKIRANLSSPQGVRDISQQFFDNLTPQATPRNARGISWVTHFHPPRMTQRRSEDTLNFGFVFSPKPRGKNSPPRTPKTVNISHCSHYY
jgi:hypothetical protein